MKKFFEINEKNPFSIPNIVLAAISGISIFFDCGFFIGVMLPNNIAVQSFTDIAVLIVIILIPVVSTVLLIIRNLKLKSVSKFILHTVIQYALGIGVFFALFTVYALLSLAGLF